MKKSLKKNITKGLIIFGAGFLALFIFRFCYGLQYKTIANNSMVYNRGSFDYQISNIASSKMVIKGQGAVQQYKVDQKYQKVATLNATSAKFSEDEAKIRDLVKSNHALIQFEQNNGLPGRRVLHLAIGVPPEQFDRMIKELKEVGEIKEIHINKVDKTNEFKELNGERSSLEKTRNALIALKSRGGRIDEFINLENRILEIEDKLQRLGVQLGEYDATNEFCTAKLTLTEKSPAIKISVLHRIKVALEWTIKYYLLFLVIVLVAALTTLVFIIIIDKVKNLLGTSGNIGKNQ